MIKFLSNKIKKNIYYLIITACILALILAYCAEILWNLNPCMLCLYQRLIYISLIIPSLLIILLPSTRGFFSLIILLLICLEVGLAAYNVAIEHYLIEESYICSSQAPARSILQKFLSFKRIASNCSDIKFKFMNFSMAEWNLVYSSLLLYIFVKRKRK